MTEFPDRIIKETEDSTATLFYLDDARNVVPKDKATHGEVFIKFKDGSTKSWPVEIN